jgi:hypothetical protein
MTKKELEKELLDLRNDFRQMTSVVSEVFVQHGILKSKEPVNQELLRLVNKKRAKV